MTQQGQTVEGLPNDIRKLLSWGGGAVGAFVVFALSWSTLAQITTTLRLPGALSPTAPSYLVQHEAGGRVASLQVRLHEEVEAGALLLKLDVSDETVQLMALEERKAILEAELDAIVPRLEQRTPQAAPLEESDSVALAYAAQDSAFHAQLSQLRAEGDGLTQQAVLLGQRYESQNALLELTRARFQRGSDLSQRGLLPKNEFEALVRELHAGEAALLEMQEETIELNGRAEDVELGIARLREERRETLAATRLKHERDLIDTRARIARLREVIARASVHAPVSGKVTDLLIDTPGLIASPGATLLTLTQEIIDPQIDLFVPPSYIDQVRVGQEGLLTVTSLSQRSAPRIRVTLTDIAREPVKDQQGNAIHYLARASISAEDLEEAKAALGSRFQLSVGVPVSAAMNGRNTTLWEFVTGPFTGLLTSAFED